MKYIPYYVVILVLSGCVDHHMIKPFKCKCDCDEQIFECVGEEVSVQKDVVSKYIKNNID